MNNKRWFHLQQIFVSNTKKQKLWKFLDIFLGGWISFQYPHLLRPIGKFKDFFFVHLISYEKPKKMVTSLLTYCSLYYVGAYIWNQVI